jgi:hypothetical protein
MLKVDELQQSFPVKTKPEWSYKETKYNWGYLV